MTLKEKFKKEGFSNCEYLEKTADDFAIGFTEWLIEKEYHIDIWIKNNSTKKLLEIYKKEKGL